MSHLYVSDLDGTLLHSDGTLSPGSRARLQRALAAGVRFTVATARSAVSVRPRLAGLDLELPAITLNGAFLTDLRTGEHLERWPLETSVARRCAAYLAAHTGPPMVSGFDGPREVVHCAPAHNAGMVDYLRSRRTDPRLRVVEDPAIGLDDVVVGITLIDERPAIRTAAAALSVELGAEARIATFPHDALPAWWWLLVQHPEASKAAALRRLSARLEIGLEQMVVFGDQANDLGMMALAGHSVAVGNAADEVRAAADVVLDPQDEDSVARYVLEHCGVP